MIERNDLMKAIISKYTARAKDALGLGIIRQKDRRVFSCLLFTLCSTDRP